MLILPTFFFSMGAIFAGYGFMSKQGMTDFTFVIGAVFLVFSIAVFLRNQALFGDVKMKQDE